MQQGGKHPGLNLNTWIKIQSLPKLLLILCMALCKLLNFFEPQFLPNNSASLCLGDIANPNSLAHNRHSWKHPNQFIISTHASRKQDCKSQLEVYSYF